MQPKFNKDALPTLGVGLSFRAEMADEILTHADQIDFFELIVETAFSNLLPNSFYQATTNKIPIVAHGISCSIGSLHLKEVEAEHLRQVSIELDRLGSPWFSEHLAFTKALEVDAGQLLPLQYSSSMVEFVSSKIKHMAQSLGLPLLIENIAYYFDMPGAEMAEIEFIIEVVNAADCGLLLDVNNLYANSINHNFDPLYYIDELPADRVVEIHVAGGEEIEGVYIDTHGHQINEAVFELLDYACNTKRPKAIVLEREKNFPEMDVLLRELKIIKGIWDSRKR